MSEGSEINGKGEQEKIGSASINQSNELYLVKNENLKKLLEENPELKKEVEETEKLINTKLKIKTIEEFDEIVGKITELGFKTAQEAEEKAERLNEVKSKEELEVYLKAKKFCYYKTALDNFLESSFCVPNDNYLNLFDSFDSNFESILNTIDACKNSNYRCDSDQFTKICMDVLSSAVRTFLTSRSCISLILLRDKYILGYIRDMTRIFPNALTSEIILILLSTPDRYNFFLQWHKMLEESLPAEDKRLFYNYLTSCREKLQDKKDYYNWFIENNFSLFTRREKQLTAIVVFGIIASAVVLILSLFNIVNLMWLVYIGIVLTVAVGIRLFFCLKENLNDLRKLDSDLQKESKTIQGKITEIDCAIDVYDLNKIKSFKEPEPEKISTFDVNKNKIILNDNEINTNKIDTIEQGNDSKPELTITKEGERNNKSISFITKNLS